MAPTVVHLANQSAIDHIDLYTTRRAKDDPVEAVLGNMGELYRLALAEASTEEDQCWRLALPVIGTKCFETFPWRAAIPLAMQGVRDKILEWDGDLEQEGIREIVWVVDTPLRDDGVVQTQLPDYRRRENEVIEEYHKNFEKYFVNLGALILPDNPGAGGGGGDGGDGGGDEGGGGGGGLDFGQGGGGRKRGRGAGDKGGRKGGEKRGGRGRPEEEKDVEEDDETGANSDTSTETDEESPLQGDLFPEAPKASPLKSKVKIPTARALEVGLLV